MKKRIVQLVVFSSLLPLSVSAQIAMEDTPELSAETIAEFERRAREDAVIAAKAKAEPFPNPFAGDDRWQPVELSEEEKLNFPDMLTSEEFKDNTHNTTTEIRWAAFRNSETGELALVPQIIAKPMSDELREEIRRSKEQIEKNKTKYGLDSPSSGDPD